MEVEDCPVVRSIRSHEKEILDGSVLKALSQCPCCHERVEDGLTFKIHATRRRKFLVVVATLVYEVRSMLARLACSNCDSTFTFYPAFALPRKRYTAGVILARSQMYVETEGLSYRETVKEAGRLIGRAGAGDDLDERCLAHTSLHRWITTLGDLRETLRAALRAIKQARPHLEVFRVIRNLVIDPRKYRSVERKLKLQCRAHLALADEVHNHLLGRPVFPDLARAYAWT